MDKRTIKSLILELKEDGKSFQEISDILARNYGVKMSRQAVYGMYKRITSDKAVQNNVDIVLATTDIVNYSAIGIKNKRIRDILQSRNINISLTKIDNILSENTEYKRSLYSDMLSKVSVKIKNGEDIEVIKESISYKGELPSDRLVNKLMYDYAILEIEYSAASTLARLYSITEDKNIVKQVSNKFNLTLTAREIGRAMND